MLLFICKLSYYLSSGAARQPLQDRPAQIAELTRKNQMYLKKLEELPGLKEELRQLKDEKTSTAVQTNSQNSPLRRLSYP